MYEIRILMTNEPRSYRETIALALKMKYPHAEVATAEPGASDAEVARLGPQLVICSRVTDLIKMMVPTWVELYSEYGQNSIVSFEGRCSTVADIDLEDLIYLVDRTRTFSLDTA